MSSNCSRRVARSRTRSCAPSKRFCRGGFELYGTVEVENSKNGAVETFGTHRWIQTIAPGETVDVAVEYGFPIATTITGSAVSPTPVPGEYRLTLAADRPHDDLAYRGEKGVLPETDETNNTAEARSDGVADAGC